MRCIVALMLLLFFGTALTADARKSPVPDDASQKEALAQIQSIYKVDYEKSKSASQKLEMAQKMLKESDGTKDDAVARFVLLRVARDIATQHGDLSTAFESIDRIAESYEVDGLSMKIDAAKTAVKAIKTPPDHQPSLERLLPLVDSLVESEQYDAAKSLGAMALSNARGTRDASTVKAVIARLKEIEEIITAYQKVEEYASILKNKATDPTANLELGKFYCFVRGDWDRGVPMLALGSDAQLSKLAIAEIQESVDNAKAGDDWWDYGEALPTIAQRAVRQHAAALYAKALPTLSGLNRKKVVQRLIEIQVPPYGKPIVNSIGMELKLLPAGKFIMGSAKGDAGETPHEVTLTKPFYLGVYEVTQEQYAVVMGSNPSGFKGANLPVEQVTWDEATEFCRRLSNLPKERAAGRLYRLPTEAEWEYACRAGTATEYSFGDEETKLIEHAWFERNSASTTHPVGQKKPNPWGLYDMHGNVWEWCLDGRGAYPSVGTNDPTGPSSASDRVFRGGSWSRTLCRSALRFGDLPAARHRDLGFRVALSASAIPE